MTKDLSFTKALNCFSSALRYGEELRTIDSGLSALCTTSLGPRAAIRANSSLATCFPILSAGSAIVVSGTSEYDANALSSKPTTAIFCRLGSAGTQLILGVRPEAIAVLTDAHADAVPAEIELVEPMGSVNNIVLRFGEHVEADGEPLIAVVTSRGSHERGEKAWIRLRPPSGARRPSWRAVGSDLIVTVMAVDLPAFGRMAQLRLPR